MFKAREDKQSKLAGCASLSFNVSQSVNKVTSRLGIYTKFKGKTLLTGEVNDLQ